VTLMAVENRFIKSQQALAAVSHRSDERAKVWL